MSSVLRRKSFAFAVRVVNLYRYMMVMHGETILSKQLLRSGTAIGAMIREAEFAESTNDFRHKLSMGLKEANESVYWVELLYTTKFLDERAFESINRDALELVRMLVASIKTIKYGGSKN